MPRYFDGDERETSIQISTLLMAYRGGLKNCFYPKTENQFFREAAISALLSSPTKVGGN